MAATQLKDMSADEVAAVVSRIAEHKSEWNTLNPAVKLGFLEQIRDNLDREVDNWAQASAQGNGYDAANPQHGHLVAETYLKGPAVFGMWVHGLIQSYTAIVATGAPPPPAHVRHTPSGANAVTVFPHGVKETIFAGGMRAEVYIESDKVEQGSIGDHPPGLIAILAAGNFDAPTDVLHAMFVQNQVAVVKSNPVNCASSPVIQRIFEPLASRNFLGFVSGGIPAGQALTSHPAVDRLLLTGSCRSYDVIMCARIVAILADGRRWGSTPEEQKANKAAGKKKFTKEFDAELGSVNPYIICPGNWTEKQLEAHAQQLVSFKMFNNGHICASPQVVITCKNWPQRAAFLKRVRELLALHPGTRPYYPNSDKSYAQHLGLTTAANVCNNPDLFPNQQHPIFTTDLPQDTFLTQSEAFCPVLGEVPLDTPATAQAFLPAAVAFANKSCWGSLTATLIVDPATQAANKAVVYAAVDDLKFGAVSVNYGAINHPLFGQITWGAYPRHPAEDIQSGTGRIGNVFMYKNVTKSVVWGPFTHPAQSQATIPLNPVGRLKRDSIFANPSF